MLVATSEMITISYARLGADFTRTKAGNVAVTDPVKLVATYGSRWR